MDDTTREVYFLIQKFLENGPCQEASKALQNEMEKNGVVPKCVNWLGESSSQSLELYTSKLNHIGSDHLMSILKKYLNYENTLAGSSSIIGTKSLLSTRINKPFSKKEKNDWERRNKSLFPGLHQEFRNNPVHLNLGRELWGSELNFNHITPTDLFQKFDFTCRTLGHLSAVYCVLFDNTSKYIITGADDTLVKIWCALDGRLLATLRGSSAEITDLTINNENTLLAVGCCDKVIRVWCLSTCAPIAMLNGQGGNITSIFFCPMPRSQSQIRYLASTSTDGSVAFWAYTDEPGCKVEFQQKPTLYLERMRPGHAQILCASFSTGGLFMAAGSADNNVRVYYMLGSEGPQRILEVEEHSDRVDSISWSHKGLRFISGSKDGTALIWRYESRQWRYIRINCSRKPPGEVNVVFDDPKKRLRVTMVAWNTDDKLVFTAVSDCLIKVWNPNNGALVKILQGHSDEAYVIEPNPINPRVVCTASHDGRIIIWDVGVINPFQKGKSQEESEISKDHYYGKILYNFKNVLTEEQGHGAVFDTKWAPDGLSLAATDSHGHLIILSPIQKITSKFNKLPKDLFFHTDYRPVTRDAMTLEIFDEQTQVLPHLMPPPFLVDIDGNPYPPELQRLVPGREFCKDEQLVPNVAVSAAGSQEVIEGIPARQQPAPPPLPSPSIEVPPPSLPSPSLSAPLVPGAINPRSNIDQMIQQLAIEQGLGGRRNGNAPGQNNNERRSAGGGVLRRSGDVEGIRQTTGDWQRGGGNFSGFKRCVVKPLSRGQLASMESYRKACSELEEEWYQLNNNKAPPPSTSSPNSLKSQGIMLSPNGRQIRSKRLRKPAQTQQEVQNNNNNDLLNETEGVARPNPPQEERSYSQYSPQRRTIPAYRARPRTQRRVRYDVRRLIEQNGNRSDSDNAGDINGGVSDSSDEDSLSNLSSSDYSEDDSLSDLDWVGSSNKNKETRSNTNTNVTASTSTRKKRKRNISSNSGSGHEEATPSKKENGEPKPGPSTEITKPVKVKTEPNTKNRQVRKAARVAVQEDNGFDEIPEAYRPSEWLSEFVPKRSPYFPQIGDDLVYFRQGHEDYVKLVEEKKLYEINKKARKSFKWNTNPDLPAEIPVRVMNIKFELVPPRLVSLKLNVTDWETGELINNNTFTVVYHDVPNVIDFFVLRQIHDKSIRNNWIEGDKFRCLIDRNWWLGKVINKEPYEERFLESKFLSYNIEWNDGQVEKLSPWDMEVIPQDFFIPENSVEEIPASESDLRSSLYEVKPSDWPPSGHQDVVCERISSLISNVMELSVAEAFSAPVDLNAYPDYAMQIEYFIDLTTIKARLDHRFYRRIPALVNDIEYIALNAEKYNEPKSDIIKHARILKNLLKKIVEDHQDITGAGVTAYYHHLSKTYVDSPSENTRKFQGESSKSNKKYTKKSRKSNNKYEEEEDEEEEEGEEEEEPAWEIKCYELLEKIYNLRDAVPFRVPVNTLEYRDYNQVIDYPIDLTCVREDLGGGNYRTPHDFAKDMRLIFSNSKKYNSNKQSKIYTMTLRVQNAFEAGMTQILKECKSRKLRGSKSKNNNKGRKVESKKDYTPKKSLANKKMNGYKESPNSKANYSTRSRRLSSNPPTPKKSFSSSQFSNYSTRNRPPPQLKKEAASSDDDREEERSSADERYSPEPGEPGPSSRLRNGLKVIKPQVQTTPSKTKVKVEQESEYEELEEDDNYGSESLNGSDEEYIDENTKKRPSNSQSSSASKRSTRRRIVSSDFENGENDSRRKSSRIRHETRHSTSTEISPTDLNNRITRRNLTNHLNQTNGFANSNSNSSGHFTRSQSNPSTPKKIDSRSSSSLRNTPPRLKKEKISENEEEEEEEEHDEEEDDNIPGPSNRAKRNGKGKPQVSSANIKKFNTKKEKEEEEEEEDDGEEEEEENSEDEDQEEDASEEEVLPKSSRSRKSDRSRQSSPPPPKRRRVVQSSSENDNNNNDDNDDDDDEEYDNSKRKRHPRKARSRQVQSFGQKVRSNLRTRGEVDYVEDSDQSYEATISVSSRGRTRKVKKFKNYR